jgi:hypothetical protein
MNSPSKRLLVRFFVLTILVALTAFSLGLNGSSTTAASCCTACAPDRDACYVTCDAGGGLGACYSFCDRQFAKCNSTCDPGC